MPFYRGRGGAIFELDPPHPKMVHAVELRERQIASGDLVEIPADRIRRVETPHFDQRTGGPAGVVVTFEEIRDLPAVDEELTAGDEQTGEEPAVEDAAGASSKPRRGRKDESPEATTND